jgi:hypothetical protein
VNTWRDTASAPAQDDLDNLLSTVVPIAELRLGRYGEFFPFGAIVSPEGQIGMLAADPDAGERPASQLVLDDLYAGVRSNADSFRAVAIVADVRVAGGGDAVRVELEHKEGAALVVVLPYGWARKGLKKAVIFGQMTASAGHRRVWQI